MEDKRTAQIGEADTKAVLHTEDENRWTKLDHWLCALHLFTLCSLAFAKPLFEVTAKDAAFYVVRGSTPVDIVSLIIFLSFLIPSILIALESLFRLFSRRSHLRLHFLLVGLLVSLYTAQIIKHLKVDDGYLSLSIIAVCGVCGTLLYARTQSFRRLISLASPVIILLPLFFIFGSPVGQVIAPELLTKEASQNVVKHIDLPKKPPIIFIIMDEFPVISLLDASGNIDEKRFPNFAEFAKTAYWFSNTVAASTSTTTAVPAILTGLYPSIDSLPNLKSHPNNLFTLLSADYKFNVRESATYLCPEGLTTRELESNFKRMQNLLSDISILYLHIILPNKFTHKLPSITNKWGNFASFGQNKSSDNRKNVLKDLNKKIYASKFGNRADAFRTFTRNIKKENSPSLNFFHIMMPHAPFEYLPSTKRYTRINELGLEGATKSKDRFTGPQGLVDDYHRLHILQLAGLDNLIGELVKHLKSSRLFDDSMILFVADHGASFVTNDFNRRLSDTNVSDLAFVPLLIKIPNQHEGKIVSARVATVDIIPTVADVLGAKLPWNAAGTSLLKPRKDKQSTVNVVDEKNNIHVYDYSKLMNDKNKSHQKNIAIFGLADNNSDIWRYGKNRHLIGKPLASLKIQNSNIELEVNQNNCFDSIDLNRGYVPSFINGKVKGSFNSRPMLAFSVNGFVQAVTEAYQVGNDFLFSAVIPDTTFVNGYNDVDCFLVSTDTNGQQFLTTTNFKPLRYVLHKDEISSSDGKKYKLISSKSIGHVEAVTEDTNILHISGWARNMDHTNSADAVLVFANGKFVTTGKPTIYRADISKDFKTAFEFRLNPGMIKDTSKIRVFCLTGNTAAELSYRKGLGLKADYL